MIPALNFKKLVIILGGALVLLALGLLLVKIFGGGPLATQPSAEQPGGISGGAGLPQAGQGPGQIVEEGLAPGQLESQPPSGQSTTGGAPATPRDSKIQDLVEYTSFAPTLSGDGAGVQYYDQADNKFYKIGPDNQATELSSKNFYNVKDVVWSPQKNSAVIEYPDATKIIYNFTTDKQITLEKHWEEFAWSPNGEQLVFKSMGADTSSRWLGIIAADGSQARAVEKIGDNADKVIVSWSPASQVVALMPEGDGFDQKKVYFIGLHGENFKSMDIAGRGFLPNWSPSGDKLLYSVYSSTTNFRPLLWVAGSQGDDIGANRKPLAVETWADKCVFADNDTAYCAVPKYLADNSGMYPTLADKTPDDVYLLNLTSGAKTLIDDTHQYTITSPTLTADGKFLYFIDKPSGRLYKLAL